ncbi:hypothetical protein GCM10009665_14640 [Kitasatospora nipponensis]|uniref:Alanine-rich protein n=1 Tax=Kitasatospora nipponensis TaxID=258049 RepID=A0ABN1VWD3_9ACTN
MSTGPSTAAGPPVQSGVNLYPWDVVGDPGCAERIASLGVDRVTLAAAYHTVRALTPHHPDHKVVTAAHSAAYYRIDATRWAGPQRIRPVAAHWAAGSFGQATRALTEAGLEVYGWAVLAHNQRLGTLHPQIAVVNAHGDHYPWALCIANPSVQQYCATLAAEAAGQPGLSGLELESCGWYGFDHLHAHDKTAGVPLSARAALLFSLCFCVHCAEAYHAADADPVLLRAAVRDALDAVFTGHAEDARLDPEAEQAVTRMRTAVAARLRARVLAAVHAERPDLPVLLHSRPDPLATGACPGVAPGELHRVADGPVLPCNVRSAQALESVHAHVGAGRRVVATVSAVRGLGADTDDLPQWCADLVAAGAAELRVYHAGLASRADLAAIRATVARTAG